VNRTAIVIALVATFLIGASLGLMSGILFTMYQHRMPHAGWMGIGPRMGGPRFPSPGMGGDPDRRVIRERQVLPHLRAELGLTDEQVERIRPLLDEAHASMGAARDSLHSRIERVLTPGQRERLRRLEGRRGFPGEPRDPFGRAHRAQPGDEGEPR
jgi:hypothetical protein